MAIVVDSSQWTGERDETPLAIPVVWGEFADEAARDNAMARLRAAGARDPGLEAAPAGVAPAGIAANEGQVGPPDENPEQADRRNLRQNAVGIAMAGSAMAAAGIVIATGGAALPAVAAAAAAGVASGAVGEAIGNAAAPATDSGRAMDPPVADGPVIGLQAPDAETRARVEQLLREAGARRVFVQETRAG
ncbi:hypothetical protein [Falsiroseomonas sp. CW058]|uniref:hypothetical protein n=1 Tax=Falsiroseomonas sp. CW058 TaxID=3388664 RepID=UPI003D314335